MVAAALRLRLAGLANALRNPRSAPERGVIVLAVLGIVLAVAALVSLATVLGPAPAEIRRLGLVTVGSLILLGFWGLPLAFGVDDGNSPRAFVAFGIRPRSLAAALALGGLLTIPVALLVLFVLIQISLWAGVGAGVTGVAILGGALGIALAVLGARVAGALAAEFLGGIVGRNVIGLAVLSVLAIAAPLFAALTLIDWPALGITQLRRWTAILAWTPWGAPWSAPGDVAAGDGGVAVARLAIAAGAVVVLWVAWELIVRRALSSRALVDAVRHRRGLGVFAALPATQTGAVAARSIVYWVRDPRYSVPPLLLPVIPLVIVPAFALAGVPADVTVWLPVPLMCLLLGWLMHNDVSADGAAFWLHVVTGVSGRADRWGRIIVPLTIGVPLAVGGSIVSAVLYGDTAILLPLGSLSLCALLSGLGIASAASAQSPYPSVAPGDSAFALPQQGGDDNSSIQARSLILTVLACAPTVALILWSLLVDPQMMVWAKVSGIVMGVLVLFLGVELGARVVRRAAPELLEFARSN